MQRVSQNALALQQAAAIRKIDRRAAESFWDFIQYSWPCSQQSFVGLHASQATTPGDNEFCVRCNCYHAKPTWPAECARF